MSSTISESFQKDDSYLQNSKRLGARKPGFNVMAGKEAESVDASL